MALILPGIAWPAGGRMTPAGGGGWGRLAPSAMPSSGVLQVPFGRLRLLHRSWMVASGNLPQHILNELARRCAHWSVPNLLTGDYAAVDSLPERLADEIPLDRALFDQIKNRAQRRSKLETLRGLYVALG